MIKSARIPIRVTPELKADLERLAKADGRTLSDYVRRVLEQHVKSAGCFEDLATVRISGLKHASGDIVVATLDGQEFIKVVK